MSPVTVYHNPRCSKSRQTITLLESRGVELQVVEYLKSPPDEPTMQQLCAALDCGPRGLLRSKEEAYVALGLADPTKPDREIIQAIREHPILLERPIVLYNNKAVFGRPPENVLALLS